MSCLAKFMLTLSQIWPMETILSWLLCPFDMSSLSFFEHFQICWHSKMFLVHLILFLPQRWFLQGAPGTFQWRIVFRNQDLSIRYANGN